MPRPEPISAEQRAAVLAAARRPGATRNGVARETGVSPSSVSRICKRAGVTFDRVEQTELATAVRAAEQRADRVEVAAGLLADVDRGRQLLAAAENPRQWLDYAKGVQALAQAHARLAEVEHRTKSPEDSAAEGRSLLTDLMGGLQAWRAAHDRDDDQDQDHDQEGATP